MSSVIRGAAAAASAMLLVALVGCAGNPGSSEAELHQERTHKQSAAARSSADLQGERLAGQAAAQAAAPARAGTNAAEMQGARLAEYAETYAGSGGASWAEHRGIED
ncbi:hypothetical protein [Agromyces italicus]|uniref:hypothetical protein n=1 Tax=Agromyces italicus TaxID=279572 RepID=UPI000412D985|nr:hypothetical protein [Agromyces italicus]